MRADAGAVGGAALDVLVVVVGDADEDTDVGAGFKIEHDTGVLNRLPGGLEEQALLGVDVGRFARRDAEELWVKLVEAVDEAAAFGDAFAGDAGFRVVEPFDVPAVRRHLGDDIASLSEDFPERFGVMGAAGKAAAYSDNGDGVVRHGRAPVQAGAETVVPNQDVARSS